MRIVLIELGEEFLQVLTCELPIERLRRRFPVVLKIQQALSENIQVREIIRGKDFSLDDRNVNLDLIKPTRVRGGMNELHDRTARISLAQTVHRSLPAMHRAVVHNPEDATGIVGVTQGTLRPSAIEVPFLVLDLALP
jgi:hypothetical protein